MQNKVNLAIENALKNLLDIIDVNTVIGQPYEMDDGDRVFPISKVTFGVLCGGGEYGKVGLFDKNKELPLSAGNGSIVSIKPCGFLIKHKDDYKVISVGSNTSEKLIDKFGDIIEKIQEETK